MKKLLYFAFAILLFSACEKDQVMPIENEPSFDTPLDFRDDAAAISLIETLQAQVDQMEANGDIGHGPAQSIWNKLKSIKKKLEQGQTDEALDKITELITHLNTLGTDGTVAVSIIDQLISSVNTINCEIDPEGGNCGPATIEIGGLTWMAENLNVEVPGSWCYGNNPANCAVYGRLYTFESAQVACAALGDGWRVPTDGEWQQLVTAVDPQWNGSSSVDAYDILTDESTPGFAALLGGFRNDRNGEFISLGQFGYYWSSTENDADYAWNYDFYSDDQRLIRNNDFLKSDALSCRCVKD